MDGSPICGAYLLVAVLCGLAKDQLDTSNSPWKFVLKWGIRRSNTDNITAQSS